MKVVYPKALTEKEEKIVSDISFKCGILKETARLLFDRGINSVESAKRFLHPAKEHFLNPYDLFGVLDAVKRITLAKDLGEHVLVFGDYDADGICATTILCGCLKKFGIVADAIIPEREEGYGLNADKILSLNSERKIDLIITVDCGISDAEKINDLKAKGIDVIVTDHHEPPEILPDCICINPKIKGQNYGFDGLCGGGVAYKLGVALIGDKADEYLDFVALATVADSMDLIQENRDIVAVGLKKINDNPRKAFRAFLGDNGKEVTAQTLAYAIAPRVNAGGRMGDASSALRLFLSEDENEIFDLSVKLNVYNATRQSLCEDAFISARSIAITSGASLDRIILVRGGEWNAGILGIVAARLTDFFNKPVIVFAFDPETKVYKGSARSVEDVNIYDAINSAKEYLLNFGGHSQAAGLSVSEENFEPLRRAINNYAEENFTDKKAEKTVAVDLCLDQAVPIRLAEEIDMLEPFGVGNRRPLFATDVEKTTMTPLKEGSPHYSFKTDAVEILDFNGVNDVEALALPIEKTVVFELNLSSFRNKKSVKGFLRNVVSVPNGIDLLDTAELSAERDAFADTFTKISENVNRSEKEFLESALAGKTEEGKRQFLFCYEVFLELGFFVVKNGVILRDFAVKRPLTDSVLYKKVQEKC